MADLSPAAQAVLNAVEDHGRFSYRKLAAAALRAAVEQVVPEDGDMPINLAHRVRWDARQSVRYQLLAIATELEGAQ